MNKKKCRDDIFKFLNYFGEKTRTKFDNICGKTGQYNVPPELYQKRTNRSNRVLISWKTIEKNDLTLEQLESFKGGCVVEFVNNDFFTEPSKNIDLFKELKSRLGSDLNVSSIIAIRSESGSSSSGLPREAFSKLINNTKIHYLEEELTIDQHNYQNYFLEKKQSSGKRKGKGNEKWGGFLFISIKGGQQDTIESHKNNPLTLFNPACEYANEDVCLDIDLVMSYFALISISKVELNETQNKEYDELMSQLQSILKSIEYDHAHYSGNLLNYCDNHPSIKMQKGELYDPIQVKSIKIDHFGIDNKSDENCLDFTHDEAVNKDKYYWDKNKKCILSATRPTNIFWSKHLSNMMQQNFTLSEYFQNEEEIVNRRNELLNKHE